MFFDMYRGQKPIDFTTGVNTALAVCCVFGEKGGISEFLESVKLYREVEFTISCNIAPDKKNQWKL